MLKKKKWLAAVFCAFLACGAALAPEETYAEARPEEAFMGYWLSQGHDGVFKIETCGDTVCGRLVGLQYDGTNVPRDKKGQSECNLLMLTEFRQGSGEEGRWNGKILDPDSGHVYQARI